MRLVPRWTWRHMTPPAGLSSYALVFWRALSIVTATAVNVVNVSQGRYLSAFITGGILSAIWWGNSRTAAHSDLKYGREVYAFGAAVGTVAGMWIGMRLST